MSELYIIDVDYANFGLIVKDGIVKDAPPIASWAIGKSIKSVLFYYVDQKFATWSRSTSDK
jgi:hypothetical protein